MGEVVVDVKIPESVQHDLSLQVEDHQFVLQECLSALSDLPRPGALTLHGLVTHLTLAHPHHLLVLALLRNVVDDEPPLQGGVPGRPGPYEVLLQLTSWL